MAALFTATSFFVSSAPIPASVPLPDALRPARAEAFCATDPTMTGYLTSTTSGSPPAALIRTTTGVIYGYISNVDSTWSCTSFYRYTAPSWNTQATTGNFDWGLLINSQSVPCNWVPGETNFLKANTTSTCPSTDSDKALQASLSLTSGVPFEHVYQNDSAHRRLQLQPLVVRLLLRWRVPRLGREFRWERRG